MGLNKLCIGDLIAPFKQECGIPSLTPSEVSGINADKEFFEPAKQVGADTSKYKVVPSGYFACNLMHVGRDVVLPVALNRAEHDRYVSPAYSVFYCKTQSVSPTYLFMYFNSCERDRYFWFHTDASVRDGMSWSDFCECEIGLPSLQIQRKYAAIYESMLANQRSYERGLDDLGLSLDALYDCCKHAYPTVGLGELLVEIDARNDSNLPVKPLGVTLNQRFQPSRGQIEKRERYKQVAPGQIVVNLIHVGRDAAFPIAKNDTDKILLVSPDYYVFEPRDIDTARYLMGWFSRSEVGRYGWFICDVDVRGRLNIEKFYEMSIPYPPKKTLHAVAELQAAYKSRFDINERLKSQLKDICPVLIRGSIEEASR